MTDKNEVYVKGTTKYHQMCHFKINPPLNVGKNESICFRYDKNGNGVAYVKRNIFKKFIKKINNN